MSNLVKSEVLKYPMYLVLEKRGAVPVSKATYIVVQRDSELRLTKSSIRELATGEAIETTWQVDGGAPYTIRDGQSVLDKMVTVDQLRQALLSQPHTARILAERARAQQGCALERGALAS